MRSLLLYSLFLLCLSQAYGQTPVEVWGDLSVSGNRIVDEDDNPVQLQGMSLYWSQWKPEFYSANVVNKLSNEWCNTVVRAAMAVEDVNGYGNGYLAQPELEKAKVETVVDAAIDEGVYVIIDWHDHEAHNHQTEAVAFFTEMAEKYGEYDNVIFEIYNEPLNVSWSNDIKPYAEEVIAAIRQHSDNLVVVGTPNWSQYVDIASADPITDYDNIAYTLHFYTGEHGEWLINRANTAMNTNNVALFVTEFGIVDADGDITDGESIHDPARMSEINTWFDFLDQNDLSYANWSLGNVDEGASVLAPTTGPNDTWTDDQLTERGLYMKNRFNTNCPDFNSDDEPNGLLNLSSINGRVYPNPFISSLSYELPEELRNANVQILNSEGVVVKEFILESLSGTINLKNQAPGLYTAIVSKDDKLFYLKLSKTK